MDYTLAKLKVISHNATEDYEIFEKEVNEFIRMHKVLDIHFKSTAGFGDNDPYLDAFIIYL